MDLSIIVPYVGEFPQVLFTIQSVAQNLIGSNIDFEIIAVNNYCAQVKEQSSVSIEKAMLKIKKFTSEHDLTIDDMIDIHKGIQNTYEDKSGPAIEACAKGNSWLKYIEYKDRLSHWQAKRVGVEASTGRILLFLDAHVVPSGYGIDDMYQEYTRTNLHELGSLHFPLTYKILEWRKLIYKMHIEEKYFYTYKFTGFKDNTVPYEVPCMSTCGMMISRDIYDKIGGWPIGLGIYGGGENFLNYTLSVCGYKKFIYPKAVLFHHGDKRDYHYVYDDFVYNRLTSHYLFGGVELLQNLVKVVKGRPLTLNNMAISVIEKHKDHRSKIKEIQKMTIEEWTKQWEVDHASN